jgi:membrane protein
LNARAKSAVVGLVRSPLSPWVRAIDGFSSHRGPVRAASLSYTSLLALVPLLALVLSLSKGIVRNQDPEILNNAIGRFLDYVVPQLQYLSPDASEAARQDALSRIQEAIGRIDAGALGAFGAFTLVTVGISLLSAIEHALNDIWGVPRGRTLGRRIVYYWAGVTLGPTFLFLAIGITGSNAVASVLGHLPDAFLVRLFWRVLPFFILSTGLTLLYWTMPNTYVPSRAAVVGGVTAGALMQLNNVASAVYFSQVVSYSKVYGSLGAIPVMMVGLYFSWMIVLYGAEVAHAAATPTVEIVPFPEGDDARSAIVLEIARAATMEFVAGRGGLGRPDLVERLGYPDEWVAAALRLLCNGGFFVAASPAEGDDGPPRFVPARPPDQIRLLDLLRVVRKPGGDREGVPATSRPVATFLSGLDAAQRKELGDVTLVDLVAEGRTT